jgi:hypothetical protein
MQDLALGQWLCQFPSLTVMVFLRRNIGYRLLNPLVLIAVAGAMVAVAVFAASYGTSARPTDLLIFAVLFLAVGIYQRIRRWAELNRNDVRHSFYIGSSPFDFRWLPKFIRRNRRVARFADPIFCALIGVAVFQVSHALGFWLVFSAFCLRGYEHGVFQRQRNLDLDMMDSLIFSERQAQVMEQFEQSSTQPQQPQPGVSTGLGQDVKQNIKGRRTKRDDSFQNN